MKCNAATKMVLFLLLAGGGACLSSADARNGGARTDAGVPGGTDGINVDDKATRKISLALGEEIDDFIVTGQEDVESAAGTKATRYTVRTSGGKNYKCQIIEPSRAGKLFSFGTAAGADALCTEFSGSNVNQTPTARNSTAKGALSNPGSQPPVPVTVSDKAARKISMAIGEDTDRFVVTKQEDVESSAGTKGTEYTVRTDGGRTYKCQVLEPSRLGKLISFGTAGGADALCTDFTKGSPDRGKTNQANCNALLRAAHKCD
ncbi:hypothetical protein H4W19_14745 [Pseudoxanthomonas mexicana]|uniref:Uncharacterized protein n=1 Tax=Pseudoxanthomonas mexicana TaxID=128785 RepID=A0ABX6R9J8_PSEMX|nr:hypothetical protein [Pseudoxanthomonas mexicana]QND79589.1 hypothetical protein H4W19_14745 [Pseudoxanthomonas mexicana]WBX93149.1 hypothetical protein PE064_15910 [Pseudoxanthomonas mexicana]